MLAMLIVALITLSVPAFFVVAFAWCLWSIGEVIYLDIADFIERRRHAAKTAR